MKKIIAAALVAASTALAAPGSAGATPYYTPDAIFDEGVAAAGIRPNQITRNLGRWACAQLLHGRTLNDVAYQISWEQATIYTPRQARMVVYSAYGACCQSIPNP